ncbi:rhomboid family intramembrane serine protease [Romeria aff. gracilis LEGE 07310]|uniref:Rhomboid family intramembrane serine protease n=1 Tax=Vasconcelosia minhoensis LEGE 07310 TaxID=915328 RepID=A0A8J7DL80_9CYAN|nr:rhomboid family intramembrane serine protease [Romeria gracilis]MBE9077061.1 rhomboid family intramembrane serine protease [Romeria aff. gracilis LEGE 07310]
MREADAKPSLLSEAKTQATALFGFVALLWLVEIIDWVIFGGRLDRYGIRPRQLAGLWGILFAPFLHGNFEHLTANTLPLLVLGWLVMLRETGDWLVVTVLSALVGGLGTWLIGAANTSHIGASGILFGYFGFLLMRGYFERSLVAIAFSILVISLYGGIVWGVLPGQPGISWEGHLFGFIGGALAARLLARQ